MMDIKLESIPEVVISEEKLPDKNESGSNNNKENIVVTTTVSESITIKTTSGDSTTTVTAATTTTTETSITDTNNTNTTTIVVADGASSPTIDLAESLSRVASPQLASQASSNGSGKSDHTHRYRHYLENKINSSSVKDDAMSRELTQFPDDNVQLTTSTQVHRTRESTITVETLPTYIQSAIESFSAPRKTVVRQYQRYRKEAERLQFFENDRYDCDIERETEKSALGSFAISSIPDAKDINASLLQEYQPGKTDEENTDLRKKGRVGFFRYFRPDYNWGSGMEVSICNRLPHDIWTKPVYINVLIELKGLVFMLGELEPFFCSLFLYDAASKTRLSESFHFDFNSDQMRQLLSKHSEPADPVTQAKHVVVSLPLKQQSDVWIIVRINKVMQGDPDLVKEPYMKLEEKDVKGIKKNKAKVSDVVAKFCERLGQYTQPFCCSAIPLAIDGDIKHGMIESDALFKVVPRDNAEIHDLISDIKDPARYKKLRLIPGTLSLNIVKPANDLPSHSMRLDPSLDLVVGNQPFNTRLPSTNTIQVNSNHMPIDTPATAAASANPLQNAMSSPNLGQTLKVPTQQSFSRAATLLSIIPVIREVQCFARGEEPIPNSEYINNLYIYPDTVNLNKAHGRNVCIKIEVRDSDNLSHPSMRLIYGKSSSQTLTSHFITETHYHNKTPEFVDEIKVKLPPTLTSRYHLLITFYHVVCNSKKKEEDSESLIGFSILPLYRERKILDNGLHQLPVALGAPKDGYLKADEDDYSLLESGKSLFKLNVNLKSSVFPQNVYLNRFFLQSNNNSLSDNDINQLLNDFIHIDAAEAIRFLPVIIKQLILVMCNREATVGCNAIKAIFIMISKIQTHLGETSYRVPLLVSFISHVFDNPKDTKIPVYSALCSRFVYFLMVKKYQQHHNNHNSDGHEVSNATLFSFCWFIFDLIIKSLSLSALETPDMLKGNREGKFDSEFIKYVPKLVSFVIHHFQSSLSVQQDTHLEAEANNSLALFIRDLFAIFDRGITLDLVFNYCHEIKQATLAANNESEITTLLFFKFDFLKLMTDYEHYLNLNIPTLSSIGNIQNLSQRLIDIHPLAGLLITEVLHVMNSPINQVRSVALSTLSTLFIKHEYDSRYQSPEKRARIAAIHLPLVLKLIEEYDRFKQWFSISSTEEKRLLIGCILFILKNLSKNLLKQWFAKEVPQRINVLFQILENCLTAFEYNVPMPKSMPNPLLQSLPVSMMSNTLQAPSSPSLSSTGSSGAVGGSASTSSSGDIPLSSISKLLKKNHNKQQQGGSLQIGGSDGIIPTLNLNSPGGSLGSGNPLATARELQLQHSLSTLSFSTPEIHSNPSSPRGALNRAPSISRVRPLSSNETTLCAEANLIILDFVEEVIEAYQSGLTDPSSPVIESVFNIFMGLLSRKQSHRVISALFASLHAFVAKFRVHLFRVNNQYCGILCQHILNYCNSISKNIRMLSSAFFYSLFKHNHQEIGNFGRVKIQSTNALSKLAGDSKFIKGGAKMLENSLATLSLYSSHELSTSSDSAILSKEQLEKLSPDEILKVREKFHSQIQTMSSKLIKIIRDTMRVNKLKAHSDPETVHELYFKIAAGYSDTPNIRLDWLSSLSSLHVEQENYFEASVCQIRIALLIHNYLEQHGLLPCALDLSLINLINPDLKETVVEEDEGVCTSPMFSVDGMRSAFLLAVNQLRMAECYEFSILLYKMIIPLHEHDKDYIRLSEYYKQSHKLYDEIIKSNEEKSRLLGRYYRVGFYGKRFEELNGIEFVYKEPKLTHLFALTERLKSFYRDKLKEQIHIFPDSSRVEPNSLEPEKLYIQITSLKPYGKDARSSYFERKTLLKQFVFITPFTLSGKTQGTITEQFHRKTILTIDGTAPNMLKRYPVVDYKEIEISPIENSIEAILQRTRLLAMEINQSPPNMKTLQGVLQGSVLLQVNAGAIEICRGFLGKANRLNWPAHHVNTLADGCTEFLEQCKNALVLNKRLIQLDQIGFHHELEMGYRKLQYKMDKYIKGEINESDEAELDQQQSTASVTQEFDDEDSQLTMTEESYDDLSIKESTGSLLDIIKDKKKNISGFLTVKEDRKSKRESRELKDNDGAPSPKASDKLRAVFNQ